MSIVSLKEILSDARKGKFAVPAFDVSDFNMARGIVDVAEELNSPVILMGLKQDLTHEQFDILFNSMKLIALNSTVKVCIHLDHATEFDLIKKAISLGYSSVMIDGSSLPLEDNISKTKMVVDYAHSYGVSVEAELGHVGDSIVGNLEIQSSDEKSKESKFTDVEEMERFIKETNVDALAISIGTSHGVYKCSPKLNLELMNMLNEHSSIPLVMHGGSGTPEEDVKKSIKLGMCKINIFSDILNGYYSGMKDFLNKTDNLSIWPSVANKYAIQGMKEAAREKFKMCGSIGKNR